MKVPDVSCRLGIGACDVSFDVAFPLLALGATVSTAAVRVAIDVALLVLAFLALVSDASPAVDFTVFFAVVWAGFVTAFVGEEEVWATEGGVLEMAFASLPVLSSLRTAAVFVAVLPLLLVAAFLLADLVTVAFMIPSHNELPGLSVRPENALSPVLR